MLSDPRTPFPAQVDAALDQMGIVPVAEWNVEKIGGNKYSSHTLKLEDGSEMSCTTTLIKAEVRATDQLLHRDSTRVTSTANLGEKALYFNIIYPLGATRRAGLRVNATSHAFHSRLTDVCCAVHDFAVGTQRGERLPEIPSSIGE